MHETDSVPSSARKEEVSEIIIEGANDIMSIVRELHGVVDKIRNQRKIATTLPDKLTAGLDRILLLASAQAVRLVEADILRNNKHELKCVRDDIAELKQMIGRNTCCGVSGTVPNIGSSVVKQSSGLDEIVLRPVDEHVDAFDEISSMLRPEDLKIKIKKSIRRENGDFLLRLGSREEVQRLESAIEEKDNLRKYIRPRRRRFIRPRIIIYGVGSSIDNANVIDVLKRDCSCNGECVKFIFDIPAKGSRSFTHRIFSVNSTCQNAFLEDQRLVLGWRAYTVKLFMRPRQCSHCLAFGHSKKFCKSKVCCASCSGEHLSTSCNNNSQGFRCTNCSFCNEKYGLNLNTQHHAMDKNCPTYVREMDFIRNHLDIDEKYLRL